MSFSPHSVPSFSLGLISESSILQKQQPWCHTKGATPRLKPTFQLVKINRFSSQDITVSTEGASVPPQLSFLGLEESYARALLFV